MAAQRLGVATEQRGSCAIAMTDAPVADDIEHGLGRAAILLQRSLLFGMDQADRHRPHRHADHRRSDGPFPTARSLRAPGVAHQRRVKEQARFDVTCRLIFLI
jgi:hypothetical protein